MHAEGLRVEMCLDACRDTGTFYVFHDVRVEDGNIMFDAPDGPIPADQNVSSPLKIAWTGDTSINIKYRKTNLNETRHST